MTCHVKCAVKWCDVSYSNRPDGVELYRFPTDERRQRWVEAVRGEGSDWEPVKSSVLCSQHFAPKAFWQNPSGKRQLRLLPGAVPLPSPQLPPKVVRKLLPNSNTYMYRKKPCPENQSPDPKTLVSPQQQQPSKIPVSIKAGTPVLRNITNTLATTPNPGSITPVSSKPGVSLLKKTGRPIPRNLIPLEETSKTTAASPKTTASKSMLLTIESPAAGKMAVPLTPPITPHNPTSSAVSVLPPSPPPSRKRGSFPPDVSATPSKAVVLSGPPVPVCLDIEDDDSPRKIALKQMLIHYEAQIATLKKEKASLVKKAESQELELHAMKEIIRKVSLNRDTKDAVQIFREQVSEDTYRLLERLAGDINGEYCPLLRSLALTLHFYSPPGYEYVREKMNNKLPCERTIRSWYSAVGGEPGFSDEALDTIKKLIDGKKEIHVVLIVDDMKIRKHIQVINGKPIGAINYGGVMDVRSRGEPGDQVAEPTADEPLIVYDGELPVADLQVEGEDEAQEEAGDLMVIAEKAVPHATDACVFMVTFLTLHLKLAIGYFLHAGLNSMMLAVLVGQALRRLHHTGVTVTGLIADGHPTNFAMVNRLGGDCRVRLPRVAGLPPSSHGHVNWRDYTSLFPSPSDPDRQIAFIPDVCHMLKLVRNSLAIWGTMLDVDGNLISWHYIQELVALQGEIGLKFANKLGRIHIEWCRQKMKTKYAAQTLSNSVADALEYLEFVLKLRRFKGASATARFIRVFNNLFDVLNSKSKFGKGLKAPMSLNNESVWKEVFRESENYIKGLKNDKGHAVINSLREKGFRGFLLAIRGVEALFEQVVRNGPLKYLLTYKMSQDSLEMFFGLIRRMGGFNNNPTAVQFSAAFKKLLFKNELKASKNGNAFPIETIKVLTVKSKTTNNRKAKTILDEDIDWLQVDAYMRMYKQADHEFCSDIVIDSIVSYLAGFVARYVFRESSCVDCASALIAEDPFSSGDVGFIQFKSRRPVWSTVPLQCPGRPEDPAESEGEDYVQRRVHPTTEVLAVCRLAERALRCTQAQGVDIVKATSLKTAAAIQACNEGSGLNIFKTLDDHVKELGPFHPHVLNLTKQIFSAYWDIRVHSLCRDINDKLQCGTDRQFFSKLIHFNNQ